jgi:lipopolysaccharide/colanic/teichoic acid biosynthesis glycosyltransferase
LSRSTSLLEKRVVRPPNDCPPSDRQPSPTGESSDAAVLSVTLLPTTVARLDVVERQPAHAPLAPAGNRTTTFLTLKRAIDVIGAVALLVLLSPLMLLTWLTLVWTTRNRPMFAQERVGFLGRPFRMYKFRTMVVDADQQQHLVENDQDGPIFKNFRDPRITPIGRLLRSLSIDETPQLFNVLFGQMSLVGPRPALAEEVCEYEPWQRARLTVKPGLTCLWQVSGRSEIGFDDWMWMDAWYVRHQSLWIDLVLLARTPWSVLSRRGAY